jgi:hypothetical protein
LEFIIFCAFFITMYFTVMLLIDKKGKADHVLTQLTTKPDYVWGRGGMAPPIFTLVLDRDEWSASNPSHFTPWETAHSTHWIGGWVGPKADLDAVG